MQRTQLSFHRTVMWVAGIICLLVAAAPAQVKDDASFFSPQAVSQANDLINQIRQRTGKQVLVETYAAIPAELRSRYDANRKDEFDEAWISSRGLATRSDVIILITREPGHLAVGAAEATRARDFTPTDHREASSRMGTAFRNKQYDQGLLDTLRFVDQRISASQANPSRTAAGTAPPPTSSVPRTNNPSVRNTPVPTTRSMCGMFGGSGMVCLIIGAIGVFLLLRAMRGRRNYGQGYNQQMGGQPGYGPQGGPGYGPGGGGGGGGFGSGMLGGVLGGVLGGAAYDHLRGGNPAHGAPPPMPTDPGTPPPAYDQGDVSSGADFGDSGSSSGADFGGNDFGGGGGGGGDFGGGGGGGGDVSSGSDF